MTENQDYDVFEEINKKYFSEIGQSVPHVQQALFDLQNEFYKSWKNTADANTSLYKEFLSDSGYKLPKEAKDILTSMGEETTKYRNICNKLAISNIESMKNAAKVWNENSDAFVELNRKIMRNWMGSISQKRK